jgi:hypothetical protein
VETPFHSLEITALPVASSQEQSNQQPTTTKINKDDFPSFSKDIP